MGEIGSHSLFHRYHTFFNPYGLDYEEIEAELEMSKEILVERGFDVKTLALPYGKYDAKIRKISKQYYSAVRPSVWGVNNLKRLDVYNLKSIWLTNSTSIKDVKKWIENLSDPNDWIIFTVHLLRYDKSSEYTITPVEMETVIRYAKANNIKIKTLSEIIDKKSGNDRNFISLIRQWFFEAKETLFYILNSKHS